MSIESDLVDDVFSCPVCKNNVMDNLICDDDNVKCTKCGTDYNLVTGKRKVHWRPFMWYKLRLNKDVNNGR